MADEDLDEHRFVSCSCCATASRMRPDIVWFGEMPIGMATIAGWLDDLRSGDLCLVVGTSGHVHPAAGIAQQARRSGATTVLVNLDAPLNLDDFDEVHLGPAGVMLPPLVEGWLRSWSEDAGTV